jgi:hypothetical protein
MKKVSLLLPKSMAERANISVRFSLVHKSVAGAGLSIASVSGHRLADFFPPEVSLRSPQATIVSEALFDAE